MLSRKNYANSLNSFLYQSGNLLGFVREFEDGKITRALEYFCVFLNLLTAKQ